MFLLVGLGNPGPSYANNRHNIGFMAIDRIARRHGFGSWRAKFQGETAEGGLDGAKTLALKPATFMNDSGRSVGEAARFHGIPPERVLVLHDDLDLAPGKLRLKTGGGHGGHNGLRGIHAHIGPGYRRMRLGIGHPGHKDKVKGYVLRDFPRSDADWLGGLLDAIADSAEMLVAEPPGASDSRFMTKVSLVTNPPPPRSPRGDKDETNGGSNAKSDG